MKRFCIVVSIALMLLCAACGRRSFNGMYYCMEGTKLLYVEADGSITEVREFSETDFPYKSVNVEMLDWNSEGALVYVQYEQEQYTFWKLVFYTAPAEYTCIYGDALRDFLNEDLFASLMQSYLVIVGHEDNGEQYLVAYNTKEHSVRSRWKEQRQSMNMLIGTNHICTGLHTEDEQTVILEIEDGTQLRLDPETMCVLSEKEPIPQSLPEQEPSTTKEADGYTIEGNCLMRNGEKIYDLSALTSISEVGMIASGSQHWLPEDFLEASIEIIAGENMAIRVRWRQRDIYYEDIILWLSLSKLQQLPGSVLPSSRCFYCMLDRQAIEVESKKTGEIAWGWIGEGEDAVYGEYTINEETYYGLTVRDIQTQEKIEYKLKDIFGVEVTGAVIPYGDKLIFACVDGSIRSYCPKTEEVSVLLEPDESRGCIWKFGLQGSTLCWYELFQQGGQMHTLELE